MTRPKTYRVRLTAAAECDVDEVLLWFRQKNAESAGARWLARLGAAIGTLETMPERFPLAPEASEIGREIRELLVGKRPGVYRVVFEIVGRDVRISRVRHCARAPLRPGDL